MIILMISWGHLAAVVAVTVAVAVAVTLLFLLFLLLLSERTSGVSPVIFFSQIAGSFTFVSSSSS